VLITSYPSQPTKPHMPGKMCLLLSASVDVIDIISIFSMEESFWSVPDARKIIPMPSVEPRFVFITDLELPTLRDIERRHGVASYSQARRKGELKNGTKFMIATSVNAMRGLRFTGYAVIVHDRYPLPRLEREITEMTIIARDNMRK
jgi:hypothetical protein